MAESIPKNETKPERRSPRFSTKLRTEGLAPAVLKCLAAAGLTVNLNQPIAKCLT